MGIAVELSVWIAFGHSPASALTTVVTCFECANPSTDAGLLPPPTIDGECERCGGEMAAADLYHVEESVV